MSKTVEMVNPRDHVALQTTTKCREGESVYRMGFPDENGFRRVTRNGGEEFVAMIAGPVKELEDIPTDVAMCLMQLESGRYVMEGSPVTVGDRMGVRKKGEKNRSTIATRPIASIEIL